MGVEAAAAEGVVGAELDVELVGGGRDGFGGRGTTVLTDKGALSVRLTQLRGRNKTELINCFFLACTSIVPDVTG